MESTLQRDPQSGHLMLLLLEGFIWFDQHLQAHLSRNRLPNVNRTESMIMLLAGNGLRRPSELARKLGLARQTINSALRNLEQKGLIQMVEDPDDRRCRMIEAVPEGERTYGAALQALADAENTLTQKLGVRKYEALKDALHTCWPA